MKKNGDYTFLGEGFKQTFLVPVSGKKSKSFREQVHFTDVRQPEEKNEKHSVKCLHSLLSCSAVNFQESFALDLQFLFQFGFVEVGAEARGEDKRRSVGIARDVTLLVDESDGVFEESHRKQLGVQHPDCRVLQVPKWDPRAH